MEWKLYATVRKAIFVAEMADEWEFVMLLFEMEETAGKWTEFPASTLALASDGATGVLAGTLLLQSIDARMMSMIAGAGFVVTGVFTPWRGRRSAN